MSTPQLKATQEPINLGAIRETASSIVTKERLSTAAEALTAKVTTAMESLVKDVPGGVGYSLEMGLNKAESAATGLVLNKILAATKAASAKMGVSSEDVLTLSVIHRSVKFEPNRLEVREAQMLLKEIMGEMQNAAEASPFRVGFHIVKELDKKTISVAGIVASELMDIHGQSDILIFASIIRNNKGIFLDIGFADYPPG